MHRPYPPVSEDSAEAGGKQFCRVPEREKHADDIRAPREPEIQVWEAGVRVAQVLGELNKVTIKKYIRESEDADQIIDRVSVREAGNPFKG